MISNFNANKLLNTNYASLSELQIKILYLPYISGSFVEQMWTLDTRNKMQCLVVHLWKNTGLGKYDVVLDLNFPFSVVLLLCSSSAYRPAQFIILSYNFVGHLMEKIESENLLHRAFSVFLFNSKYELLLQVCISFYNILVAS